MAIFRYIWPKSAKMRNFIKNRAVLFFYPYCPPTSCHVSEKSLERFPRSIRYIHPYIHPYKGDPIEPVAFAGSIPRFCANLLPTDRPEGESERLLTSLGHLGVVANSNYIIPDFYGSVLGWNTYPL